MNPAWPRCLERLEVELSPEEVHTWLKPLQAEDGEHGLVLFAPNAFVVETVRSRYLPRIRELLEHFVGPACPIALEIGSPTPVATAATPLPGPRIAARAVDPNHVSNLDPHYTFDNFVEGRSNQLARAAALQTALKPGL